MFIELLLAAASACAQTNDPKALEVLRRSLAAPAAAYEGEVSVDGKTVLVRFFPPMGYRREILDPLGAAKVVIVSDGKTEWVHDRARGVAWRGEPADADLKLIDPDEEFALLTRNYEFRLAGLDRVAGRRCDVLEVRSRGDGSLAQRLCSDSHSGMVLQREDYGGSARAESAMRFTRLALPAELDARDFAFAPPPGTKVLGSLKPDYMELDEAAEATGLRPRAPSWLPPGYIFESVNVVPYKGVTMLHYRYSDGVGVLSLFQAPRRASLRLPASAASEPLRLASAKASLALLSGAKALKWTDGDGFLLMGPLAVEQLRKVAESVPR